MKTTLTLTTAVAIVLFVIGQMSANAAESPATTTPAAQSTSNDSMNSTEMRRNAMSLELLGRGFLYSVNYDYQMNDNLAVGAGASHYSVSSGDASAGAWIIPVYANYYLTGNTSGSRWFATGGANLIFASGQVGDDSKVSGSGIAGVLGGGYEYRAENGFLFRAAPYVFVGKASGAWLGLSVGYTI